jgi:hypothetical protein
VWAAPRLPLLHPLLHPLLPPPPAGDQYRVIYEQLSKDPNSLANLDQDLPNYAQHNIKWVPSPALRACWPGGCWWGWGKGSPALTPAVCRRLGPGPGGARRRWPMGQR